MKIAIGCDHGGLVLKQPILDYLKNENHLISDFGTLNTDSVDYPIFAEKVAFAVQEGECDFGILICGTGIGVSMVANKFKTIRAALCHNTYTAVLTREHNNANVLCLGGKIVNNYEAVEIVNCFLTTEFEGGRHLNRLNLIEKIEKTNFK